MTEIRWSESAKSHMQIKEKNVNEKNVNEKKEIEKNVKEKRVNEKSVTRKKDKNSIPYMMNRELSWLKFNERVLDEAASHHVPLCERMAFFSIFQSNLDEFFMVRVGALYDQMLADREARENKTWMTSEEQLKAIFEKTRIISQRRDYIYKQYMEELSEQGVKLLNFMDMLPEDKLFLEKYFENGGK